MRFLLVVFLVAVLSFCHSLSAQQNETKDVSGDTESKTKVEDAAAEEGEQSESEIAAGHSYHGEAFNEGPRQFAYLMPGLGRAKFEVSTDNEKAQAFFNQGIDQLHGFWYFEAERSFRQVEMLDPDCAMAFWGLAMANVNNAERAKKFIAEAEEKANAENRETTEREKLYIKALAALYNDKVKDETKRAQNFVNELEEIVLAHPDDIEAKAFLVCQIWMNQRKKIKISSHVAVNALLDQIFDVDPMHPSHHYRIHLWDYKDAKVALHSSAAGGPSLPAVAHMWHMPGHIYSKLKRYEDAVWQQEASARVDHRHMMHDQILPDQIHNFAHNNEWCIRNLNHVGRVDDAIDLAKNMISMPQHPKYNTLEKRGSAWYGRLRLIETLSRYERWQELIEACHSPILEPTEDPIRQVKRLRYLARAHYHLGMNDPAQRSKGKEILTQLQTRLSELETEKEEAVAKANKETQEITDEQRQRVEQWVGQLPRSIQSHVRQNWLSEVRKDHRKRTKDAIKEATRKLDRHRNVVRRAIDEMEGHELLAKKEFGEAAKKLKKAGEVDAGFRSWVMLQDGESEKAIKQMRKFVGGHKKEVQPLANLCYLLWTAGEQDDAKKEFEKLREISSSIDMNSSVFERLQPIAEACDIEGDWRMPIELADDLGERPDLDSLGPFRWQPIAARDWELVDAENHKFSSKEFQGKPVIVIFYLGHGCLHCAEQLQTFAPKMKEFEEAGIQMVAISTDKREFLKTSIDSYGDEPLPIQLLADPEFKVFMDYRVFDEFENQPLHGTFLIDGKGKIRWQDISYEPFMEADFLLKESQRLLGQ